MTNFTQAVGVETNSLWPFLAALVIRVYKYWEEEDETGEFIDAIQEKPTTTCLHITLSKTIVEFILCGNGGALCVYFH